jgi:rubrerythrin
MDQNARLALSICKDIETTCADIYFYFAEVFADQPAAHNLWEKIAFEEKNHANLLKMALRLKDLELVDRQHDLPNLRKCMHLVQSTNARIRQCKPQLLEALQTAVQLEKQLQEFHLECVVTFKNQAEEKMFAALLHGDKDHVAALEMACEAVQRTGELDPS